MKLILATPTTDALVRLLKAWRFWLAAGAAGALLGAAAYIIAPPTYRAQATVNVDFHMEQAWPQNVDREQFYYLEREARKLEDIAWSDEVLSEVISPSKGSSLVELRQRKLRLGQPGVGAWHFYADDSDAQAAAAMASAWAGAFARAVSAKIALPDSPLERYITATPTQVEQIPVQRAVSLGIYMLSGALLLSALAALWVLFSYGRV